MMVFAPDGAPIDRIALTERCAKVCFGGRKRNRLFRKSPRTACCRLPEGRAFRPRVRTSFRAPHRGLGLLHLRHGRLRHVPGQIRIGLIVLVECSAKKQPAAHSPELKQRVHKLEQRVAEIIVADNRLSIRPGGSSSHTLPFLQHQDQRNKHAGPRLSKFRPSQFGNRSDIDVRIIDDVATDVGHLLEVSSAWGQPPSI